MNMRADTARLFYDVAAPLKCRWSGLKCGRKAANRFSKRLWRQCH